MDLNALPQLFPVTSAELAEVAKRASTILEELRKRLLLPDARKQPPMLSGDKVAELCGLTKGQMAYRVKQGAPAGVVSGRGGRRELTVEEVRQWTQAERKGKLRPISCLAAVICCGFFKGGVTKTTTTMALAQALSLLGHKVLCIDMDPQGNLTTLHGLLPEELDESQTLAPLFYGVVDPSGEKDFSNVKYAIQETYWPGIHLIPSTSAVFNAEFILPSRQKTESGFRFWNVLNKGLDAVRADYDVILIDTPPALSYMTFNAFFAADGMLVPMTPSMLDVASSAQFWSLFNSMADTISEKLVSLGEKPKTYDFVNVVLSRVNNSESATHSVKKWIHAVYGDMVMNVEIPMTTVASAKANKFQTAFDVSRYEGDYRTYKRARECYEALALNVESLLQLTWARQLTAAASTPK